MDSLGKNGRKVTLEKSVILEVITTFLTFDIMFTTFTCGIAIRGLCISMEHGNFKMANYQGNNQSLATISATSNTRNYCISKKFRRHIYLTAMDHLNTCSMAAITSATNPPKSL